MAEGFLQSDDMETLEDKYFDLLLHNSLLQVGFQYSDGSIHHYTMHDLVCDLAFSVLEESGPVRCIYLKSITDIPKEKARNVRSLIFEGNISEDNMLSDFKYLRGLVLIGDANEQLPKIEHLIHLRYLDILRTSIGCSPKLVSNLYLQQTFRTRLACNEWPEELNKLINLRHVDVRGGERRYEICEVVASPWFGYLQLLRSQKPTSCFPNLKTLFIRGMHSSPLLESLLVNITSLTEVQFVRLPGLVRLPDVFFHNNQNLTYLRIFYCWNLSHLPPPVGVSLREVDISYCPELEGLPEIPQCLHKLTLHYCSKIKSIPYNPISGGFPSLRELKIKDCYNLTELPIGLSSLRELEITSCYDLTELPIGLSSLRVLKIMLCSSLAELPIRLSPLRELEIRDCRGLTELPIELLESSSLESLCLWGLESVRNMGMVIACLQKMPRLTSLEVDLKNLANDDFPIEIVVGSFNSLRELEISCGMEMWQRLEDLLLHLNALRTLTLIDIEMEAVPEWLGKLPSLRELELRSCKKLRSLPSKEALKHLTRLEVVGCPQLKMRRDDDNSEWHKVSHIPHVYPYEVQ